MATGVQTLGLDSPAFSGRPSEPSDGLPESRDLTARRYPKLRSDLIFSQLGTNGNDSFVIKDPVRGDFFRFKEPEHFIERQLDGATPPEIICRRLEERYGERLQPEALADFVRTLEESRLLEKEETRSKHRTPRRKRRRIQGNVFFLIFNICDPNRLFDWLVGKVRFFFTPYFMALSGAAIFTAFCVIVFNWDGFKQDVPRLWHWESIPTVWAIILLVTAAHEFGHGLTCKYFGGEVHEMGFLLLLLQPCMYCNVSDAWLFPEKSKRLLVSFAGPYFELFLWALAALIWRLTDADTWLNFVAFAVTATSGVKTLLNFNPLIKMDGYYLLSDALGIHNLRRRAYAYIGAGIKRLFGIRTPVDATPREKRIFLIYGLIASAFSFCALGYMVWMLANFLAQHNQGLKALLMILFLIVAKVRRRLLRLFPQESKVWFKALKKTFVAMRRPFIALAILAVTTAVACLVRMELKVTGSFRVLPLHNADVRAEVEGIVEEVFVKEGDGVHPGDLIARLSDRDNLAELRKTEASIEESRAKLRRLEAGARPEEIDLARATVAKAEERVNYANNTLERNKPLYEQKLLSQQDFEASEAYLADRENELAEAKGKLALLLAGSRVEDIDATKAEINRLDAQRRFLEEQVRLARIVSPAAGVVATPSRQLEEMASRLVKKGDLIAKVFEMKTIELETPIPEKEIADVQTGQTVALKVRAYPDLTFYGKVASIGVATAQSDSEGKEVSAAADQEFSGKTVLVTTRIDNSSLLLKPGMTGNLKILCGQHRIVELMTRRIARTFKVEFWSWW